MYTVITGLNGQKFFVVICWISNYNELPRMDKLLWISALSIFESSFWFSSYFGVYLIFLFACFAIRLMKSALPSSIFAVLY